MKTIIKVALIALLWISAINSGTINADARLRLQMTHAWWTGTEEVDPDYQPQSREEFFALVKGVDGKRYIPYDVGQPMLMLPGDWLGTQLHRWFPKVGERDFRSLVINFVIFVPLNVAAVVSCFWLLRLFDFNERIAGLTSIAWLLGTTFLHYAQVPQQNNQVLLFVTIGYAAALAFVKRGIPHFAVISGIGLGAAFLIRLTSVIHVLTVLLFLVGCVAYQSRDKLKIIQVMGLWIGGFMPLALVERVLTYTRYGSFLVNPQSLSLKQLTTEPIWANLPELPANYPFINPPYVGILGPLFSPAKSIFIYDPLLLPCLVLVLVIWKKISPYIQWYLVTGIFNLGLHLLLTSRLDFWHGDAAWGARYHVTSVQLLLIPLVALFIQDILAAKRLKLWLMRGIITLAIIVQISSVILLFSLESAQALSLPSESQHLQFRLGERWTNIVCEIDSYFSNSSFPEHCLNKKIGFVSSRQEYFLKDRHQVALLPFNYARFGFNRKWAFVLWGLVLTLAIVTTLRFCFIG